MGILTNTRRPDTMMRTAIARVVRQAPKARSFHTYADPVVSQPVIPKDMERLASLQKGKWSEINQADKVALYRASFRLSRTEFQSLGGRDSKEVAAITAAVCAAGVAVFYFVQKVVVNKELPHTMDPEWIAAAQEKSRKYKINPISGISKDLPK